MKYLLIGSYNYNLIKMRRISKFKGPAEFSIPILTNAQALVAILWKKKDVMRRILCTYEYENNGQMINFPSLAIVRFHSGC